jgi:hypothetical protein
MPLRFRLPGLLRAYTGGTAVWQVDDFPANATLRDALACLDARWPGVAFRLVDEQGALRPHIRIFVDATPVRDLDRSLPPDTEIMIVGALSGG